METVELNTGLRIDAYTEIGFGGFVNVIDALGGIEMCLPKAIKDKDSHLNLKKGCQTLSGTNALGYVRMRKADLSVISDGCSGSGRCWPRSRRRRPRR